MKIGIVTVHRAHNCGAMLQALALQQALRRIGHAPELVEANTIGEGKVFPDCPRAWRLWPYYLKNLLLSLGLRAVKIRLFKRFLRHLALSRRFGSADEIPEQEYDAFIVGSDQVWNFDIVKDTRLFLLDFCKDDAKRLSYAASFGLSQIPADWVGRLRGALTRYRAITVREDRAAELVESLTGAKPPVVVDPTLLLEASDYLPYEAPRLVRGPYVLVYSIGAAPAYMLKIGRQLARERKCRLVYVNATSFGSWLRVLGEYQLIAPDRFLSFIRHAECVVCTSYHATIFSIHYRRPFLTVLPLHSQVTSRLTSLLNRLGLSGHLLKEGEPTDGAGARLEAPFDEVHARIAALRAESVERLKAMTSR